MAASNERPIIIKKVKKGHGHDHHGGAWKVAYADFVTAMMAFFLLMWLLSTQSEDVLTGIADYFSPTASISLSTSRSGAGGILGGLTIGQPGAQQRASAPISAGRAVPGRPFPVDESEDLDQGDIEERTDDQVPARPFTLDDNGMPIDAADRATAQAGAGADAASSLTNAALDTLSQDRERTQFRAVEESLRQAIQENPDLHELEENLIVEITPEGLRIQIVDRARYSMFPMGAAEPYGRTSDLLGLVARAINGMPNRVSISGHTDSTPFAVGTRYGNWELSSDRANASRRALVAAGLDPDRIETVVGRADTQPLVLDSPADPRNRRISIVLLRATDDPTAPDAPGDLEPN